MLRAAGNRPNPLIPVTEFRDQDNGANVDGDILLAFSNIESDVMHPIEPGQTNFYTVYAFAIDMNYNESPLKYGGRGLVNVHDPPIINLIFSKSDDVDVFKGVPLSNVASKYMPFKVKAFAWNDLDQHSSLDDAAAREIFFDTANFGSFIETYDTRLPPYDINFNDKFLTKILNSQFKHRTAMYDTVFNRTKPHKVYLQGVNDEPHHIKSSLYSFETQTVSSQDNFDNIAIDAEKCKVHDISYDIAFTNMDTLSGNVKLHTLVLDEAFVDANLNPADQMVIMAGNRYQHSGKLKDALMKSSSQLEQTDNGVFEITKKNTVADPES